MTDASTLQVTTLPHVTTLIVTFNRRDLLGQAIAEHRAADRPADRLLIVDNASTDGTDAFLAELQRGWSGPGELVVDRLSVNTGGAGGFAYGIQRAYSLGTDVLWIMDDDVMVERDALECLLEAWVERPDDLHASIAVGTDAPDHFAWSLHLADGRRLWDVDELVGDAPIEAVFAPFVGLLIPPAVLRAIGVPNSEFFIWSDDVDYCLRARDAGHRLWYVPTSVVRHPEAARDAYRIGPWRVTFLRAPLWKRYFGLRNDIHISVKRRDWARLARYSASGFAAWLHEQDRKKALPIYARAAWDGVTGKLGRDNPAWK